MANQKRFLDLVEAALKPKPLDESCFPMRWAIAAAMVFVAMGVVIAIAVLRLFTDQRIAYIALAVAATMCFAALEFSIRMILAHKDIEIKKLDVLREEISRMHDVQTQKYENGLCTAFESKNASPEGKEDSEE